MPRTILHVGAHKTATTYMQKKLFINAEALAARGIRYDRLEVLRKNLTTKPQHVDRLNPEFMEKLRSDIRKQDVLLSDENILGIPGNLVKSGVYYANAKDRLQLFAKLLDISSPEIFMSLREYSSFTVSMYSEYIRHQKFMKFSDYFELYKKSGFSWVEVVTDIVEALPEARINLWDYSNFRTIEGEVLRRMLGQDSDFMEAPRKAARESYSGKAMQCFEALDDLLTQEEFRLVMAPISRTFPKGEQYPAFNPIQPGMAETLMVQYQRDLAEIARRFPQIEFIAPPGPVARP